MRITFLLVGGFEKFKVLQKAYLEKLHYLLKTATGQKFPGGKYGMININMAYFLGPNWNLCIRCLKLWKKIFFRPPLNPVEICRFSSFFVDFRMKLLFITITRTPFGV